MYIAKIYSDSLDGKKIVNYYRVKQFPFVAILDPRTGENVHQFNSAKQLDSLIFCEKVTQFLCENGDGPNAGAAETTDKNATTITNKKDDTKNNVAVAAASDKSEVKKKEKASDIIKRGADVLNKSTSSNESSTSPPRKEETPTSKKTKHINDDDDEQETSFTQQNGVESTKGLWLLWLV